MIKGKSFTIAGVHYREEFVKCGKPNCKCCPHGPYWYAYHTTGITLHKKYVGKRLPEHVRAYAPAGCF